MQPATKKTADRSGDPEPFRRLYRDSVRKVRATLYRLAGGSHLDDLTQEVFVRVWRALPNLREAAATPAWIYRITVNMARDAQEKAARERWNELPEEMPAVADKTDAAVCRQLVALALQELSFEHRTVLVLHDLEGLTEDEIARVLEIPRGTVKSRLFHARGRARAFLEQRGIRP